ncbi:Uncharacterized protein OS=Singulisphaera acidiphila (strain ATCC BAA-1392 / DSM 18658 / VKM B-2454 / MOB10) GN=Sinac_0406 PE=4 SV=1: DUF4159 [Gemmata massiliana]|uniref:DUF4159 domain-containing protein n=1 Tax=Gemmata massiliana TaxID=1210884 RepID=A0A6P2D9N8_9BACT|nr:DUF4159 domain-containing protein [Gemmata massiliana]VTR96222.1 Uncharacterized protein OS=Singulisphaera acidiphila (strain ATCC BAA-1392 / DSM 18658 / VKM B-2454 / MOB10) GN=Sinac_0406 PE=4 SV=1: DUF4159 [Gemmata massiliana]
MTRTRLLVVTAVGVAALVAAAGFGSAARQPGRQFPYGRQPGDPLPLPEDRAGVPNWKVDPSFDRDVFTFVRIEYSSYRGRRGGSWTTDWPDADLNFSFRLQQLTSLRVNPNPISMRLTDPRLFDYPFIYIVEPGRLSFLDDEVLALRRYLTNGGFLMVDDFWGDSEWENFRREIGRVFPNNEPKELPVDHEIFRCVYHLKEKPQIPSIQAAWAGKAQGITWERGHDGDVQTVHYKGIFDDKGRMMAFIGHNTDLGDGWEREGEDPWYFREFSEKKAYPLGINVIVYAMTH